MTKVNIHTKLDLKDLAVAIAQQQADLEVLTFLEDLDLAMASWDFTSKAAELFVRTGLQLDGEFGEDSSAKASLNRVQEFIRQAGLQPHVAANHPILTVWTDPQAQAAQLTADDLSKLIELAAISLAREDKP